MSDHHGGAAQAGPDGRLLIVETVLPEATHRIKARCRTWSCSSSREARNERRLSTRHYSGKRASVFSVSYPPSPLSAS
jgi:hypothetical protein